MQNDTRAREKQLADDLVQAFRDAGALNVETDSLLPADVLLDLYGEDIRARAFVTSDPMRGERMLRPDFTVPIVQRHMAEGAEPARYTYQGKVWRKQADPNVPTETLQVGYELFDRANPGAADAEVFALFNDMLADDGLRLTTGDMGLLRALVSDLPIAPARRTALLRHLWRPDRFRALLDRFAGLAEMSDHHVDLMVQIGVKGLDVVLEEAGPVQGLRSTAEITSRIEALREEASADPMPRALHDLVLELLDLNGPADEVLARLRDIANPMPQFAKAVDTMAVRHAALSDNGIDPDTLPFEVSFGRTTLEYYDGFVFGFARPDGAIVASGGRYDALTQALGQGRSIAAVGGVIRPEALLAHREGRA